MSFYHVEIVKMSKPYPLIKYVHYDKAWVLSILNRYIRVTKVI